MKVQFRNGKLYFRSLVKLVRKIFLPIWKMIANSAFMFHCESSFGRRIHYQISTVRFRLSIDFFSSRAFQYTHLSRVMTKPTKWYVRPAKTQISLGIRPVIRIFAVRMKKDWVLSYPLSAQRRLIRLGGCPGWSESSLGAHAILFVLSWGGSFCQQHRSASPFCIFMKSTVELFYLRNTFSLSWFIAINAWCWRAVCEVLIHDGEAEVN